MITLLTLLHLTLACRSVHRSLPLNCAHWCAAGTGLLSSDSRHHLSQTRRVRSCRRLDQVSTVQTSSRGAELSSWEIYRLPMMRQLINQKTIADKWWHFQQCDFCCGLRQHRLNNPLMTVIPTSQACSPAPPSLKTTLPPYSSGRWI